MPPVSQSPGTTSQGSILLIEEYDALAAAISSALRKFAPRHRVHVARSLAEAKTLAKEKPPALIVVDFDPAFSGLSPFLQKLQKSNPNARVLILAGKLPPEVVTTSHQAGALQFVEKPFDVPDFGASVQALLGPWTEPETATSRGTLQDVGLADLVLAQCAGGRAVALEVKNDAGKTGEIHLKQGLPVHAETGRKMGEEAFSEMLRWTGVEVRERERPGTARRTIEGDGTALLLETLRRTKPKPVRQPAALPAEKPHVRTGKKLVVVDDTEMLIIFVEDVLTIADRELQITTALNGISGVKEVERVIPDLVLLDYSLPDINGDEVCRRLLQNEATAKVPVLMMSGHVPEMSKAAATCDNVVATIAKPFLSDALVSLVQRLLAEPRPVRKKNGGVRKAAAPAPPPPAPVVTSKKSRAAEKKAEPPLPPPEKAPPAPKTGRDGVGKLRRPHERAVDHEPAEYTVSPELPLQPLEAGLQETPAIKPEPPPVPETSQRIAPEPAPVPRRETISTSVFSESPNEVVLTLFLDVVSVQLTSELRMGSIRAKPSSMEASLHFISPAMRATLPQTGFKLGQVNVDAQGRITTVRLVPTLAPFHGAQIRNALQIGGVSVVPIDSTRRLQLTPAPEAPMTLRLLADLEIAGVELTPTFQVSQLVLKDRGQPLRVALSSQTGAEEGNGTKCETLDIVLDRSAQIKELVLNPLRS